MAIHGFAASIKTEEQVTLPVAAHRLTILRRSKPTVMRRFFRGSLLGLPTFQEYGLASYCKLLLFVLFILVCGDVACHHGFGRHEVQARLACTGWHI